MSGVFPLSTNLWTEDDECGVVFLQTLSRRFTSETILERVVSTVISVNAPHHAESLSQTFVPISSHIILAMVAVCCVFTVHEFRVQGGSTPLLATHDGRNTVLLQVSFLITWVVGYLTVTMFIPVSLDFALAMGESATGSGVFIGAAPVGLLVGSALGKKLTTESSWNQRRARKVFLFLYGASVLLMPVIAFFIQTAAARSLEAKRWTFWCTVFLLFLTMVLASLPTMSWFLMWNTVTPQKEKTFWMMLTQCARNGGILLGPIYFAFISYLVHKGQMSRDVSPISEMSWLFMGAFFLQALELTIASLVFPTELQEGSDEPCEGELAEVAAWLGPEELPAASREELVWNMIVYCYERTFTVSAIEVATTMLLEVKYGWTPELSGSSFIAIALGSFIMTAMASVVASRRLVSEADMFFAVTLLAFCGCTMFFDLGGNLGAKALMLADTIVYGGASVANGIAEGWASRAACKGTDYSIETYRAHQFIGASLCRFVAPVVTRFILDIGGRNTYAAVQFLVCGLSSMIVLRTVLLFNKQKSLADGEGIKT